MTPAEKHLFAGFVPAELEDLTGLIANALDALLEFACVSQENRPLFEAATLRALLRSQARVIAHPACAASEDVVLLAGSHTILADLVTSIRKEQAHA